jgi:hypothetical protein
VLGLKSLIPFKRRSIGSDRITIMTAAAIALSILVTPFGFIPTAFAVTAATVTVPATTPVSANSATTDITGISVGGLAGGTTYLVAVGMTNFPSGAVLRLNTTTGLTASYGFTSGSNTFTSFTNISFRGSLTDVNNALASLRYISGASGASNPSIRVTATSYDAGYSLNGINGHYYKSSTPTTATYTQARTNAKATSYKGMPGYLVAITSEAENSFVATNIESAASVWIGATDEDSEGTWQWDNDGGSPEAGTTFWSGAATGSAVGGNYQSWNPGSEPNDASGEDYAVTNWGGSSNGRWNDCNNNGCGGAGTSRLYVIEYGNNTPDAGFVNANSDLGSATFSLSYTPILTGTTNTLSTALGNIVFETVTATAGTGNKTLTLSSSPSNSGITIDTSTTNRAVLRIGNTVGAGTYTSTITATDAAGITATYIVTTTVSNPSNSETDSAISLNGTSQYAAASGAQVIPTSTASAFTVEAWIRQPSSRSSEAFYQILSQGSSGNVFYAKVVNGSVRFGRSGYTGGENYCTAGVPTDEWTHVALVVGASSQSCYINGSLAGSFTQSGGTAIGTTLAVGQFAPTGGEFFLGQIDEVKIWSDARTQSEIQSDLKSYGGTLADNLVAYYDFNELIGTRVLNRSTGGSSALDLVTVGTPTITSTSIIETSTVQAYTVVKFIRTFLVASGGWRVPNGVTSADLLVVGGGGGGSGGNTNPGVCESGGGGGGGGGEVRTLLGRNISANSVLTVQVGAGGPGGLGGVAGSVFGKAGNTGNSSVVSSFTSLGGGGGGTTTTNCRPSPGGTSGSGTKAGGAAAAANGAGGGGGGGDGVAGSAGTSAGGGTGGAGGAGSLSSITSLTYGGGGGGSHNAYWAYLYGGGQAGAGGIGGGGSGGSSNTFGTPNTGGGGGGGLGAGCCSAGNGGGGASGVVVIKFITNLPTILTQPLSDTTTAGIVETFTVTTSAAPAPLTKSVQWQFTTDTATGVTGWTNVSSGTGGTTDTFTTVALTSSMNKYRFRAIVTFSDTSTLSVQETSTVAILTINPAITITSDTSTITRKYGATQTTPRTLTYSGGTTSSGAVGTSGEHTVRGSFGTLASGKIVLDTSTATAVFRVDTATAVGTYVETITVTDFKGATATYAQTVVVTPADTLTVQAETPTATTYTGLQAILSETITVTGLVAGDTVSGVTYNYSAPGSNCANGGTCSLGDSGPGGGKIFYVSGSTYFEAAPRNWYSSVTYNGSTYNNANTVYCANGSNQKIDPFNPPNNTSSTGWGGGKTNTDAFKTYCSMGAIGLIKSYAAGGKSDWYIPNATEMNGLVNYWSNVSGLLAQFDTTTSVSFWTSDASYNATYGWLLTQPYFNANRTWSGSGSAFNHQGGKILPIRSFTADGSAQPALIATVTKPTNAGTYTITPSALVLANNVDTSNYVWVDYRTSTFTINKARQDTLTVSSVLGVYETGTATMKITTLGGSDTGTVTYAIASGGSASGCSVSSDVLTVTSAGTCKLVATKFATLNYLIAYSDTATITFTRFVERPLQVQLYPTMIPLNQGNALETTTVTSATLTISARTATGAGAFTITGTGFTNIELVTIGGAPVSGSNYTRVSETTLTLSGVSSFRGPLLIRLADGQESVFFQFNWS